MVKNSIILFAFLFIFNSFIAHAANQDFSDQNFIDDYLPTNADGTINAVIEIPAGTNEKWEVTKPDGKLELEKEDGKPRIIKYLGYPGNYGMIPKTILPEEAGGDGDPLDILVIGVPLTRGQVVKTKIIGILKFFDRGERDDKLVAVLPETALYSVDNLSQLDEYFPGISTIIKTWFLYYKGSGRMVFKGFGTVREAKDTIEQSIEDYQKKIN
jgi:inorganic pyrophosphatase